MAPLITLLTDFGTSDSYVAEVKAVLLSRALGAALVDVTHQIPPGDVRSAQYVLARVWRSEEHTSELQSRLHLVCRLLLEKKKKKKAHHTSVTTKEMTGTTQRSALTQ